MVIKSIKSNQINYAEACYEFAGPISASLRSNNTNPFEENWQHCVRFDQPRFKPRPSAPETDALPLDQQADLMVIKE